MSSRAAALLLCLFPPEVWTNRKNKSARLSTRKKAPIPGEALPGTQPSRGLQPQRATACMAVPSANTGHVAAALKYVSKAERDQIPRHTFTPSKSRPAFLVTITKHAECLVQSRVPSQDPAQATRLSPQSHTGARPMLALDLQSPKAKRRSG